MILKANGILEERKGLDGGRIKVLSFKKNGEYIFNQAEISSHFPPHGYVFAPKIFERFDHSIGSIVEFSTSHIISNSENGDVTLMDYNKDCKKIGFQVFPIEHNILINELSINQTILKEYINETSTPFYIKHRNEIFGPFKWSNGDVIPKTGTSVCRFKDKPLEFYSDNKIFILTEPKEQVNTVDCMTIPQLVNWFKNQVHSKELNMDFWLLRKIVETQGLQELDRARLKRMFRNIDQISMTLEELKLLAETSDNFKELYLQCLQKAEEELKRQLIEPYHAERDQIKTEIRRLEQDFQIAVKQVAEAEIKLKGQTEQFDFLVRERERLIEDLRIQSAITSNNLKHKIQTFEELSYFKEGEAYNDLKEFVKECNTSFEMSVTQNLGLAFNFLYALSYKRCILTDHTEAIIQLAKMTNNSKVVLQQVEPDWLKFENLYENGLKKIWEDAYNNRSVIHFFVLEDLNMASLECYGKPILDLIAGIRLKIPGLKTVWPENLWLFGIPLPSFEEHSFGLPLIKETFEHWGAFPKTKALVSFKEANSDRRLEVKTLLESDTITPVYLNEYFS